MKPNPVPTSESDREPGRPPIEAEPGPVLDLGDARDRRIVADALRVLLRERSDALAYAMRVADEHGRARPDAGDFLLSDIIRLARLVERAEHRQAAVMRRGNGGAGRARIERAGESIQSGQPSALESRLA
ncbi:hypothetical protein [Burkholderia gladioli]|uniref:hypothetical protein n=1 Tax=Burkholderia gladioli TaxID=28095 RepID=UPI0016401230|nr:hypothetical protein [Burkholderia gladioli]